MPDFTVEIGDLRGWATQVGRASEDMTKAHGYATGNLADANFGRILELITGDYATMLTTMHGILQADGAGLNRASVALGTSAKMYKAADGRSRNHMAKLPGGETVHTSDDGVANGFDDVSSAATKLNPPSIGGVTLPEVSFGWLFDQVCGLVVQVGGPDPREYVTKWIAGDVGKAATQVAAWQALADCVDAVDANLKSGKAAITNTWTGTASHAAGELMAKWSVCLKDQSSKMRQMSKHVHDMADQAVKMAQCVVDIIKTVISIVAAGLANAAIPLYGQVKLIKTVMEAITMLNKARKVIMVFWQTLIMVKSVIQATISAFGVDALPTTPAPAVSG